MKTTVNFSHFVDAFQVRKDNFSYDGLRALFDYLESFEEDTGEEMELDVIALCCDFTEYENIAEFQEAYSSDYETLEDIRDVAIVIEIEDSEAFIIQNF